ncbi:MAG: type II toxin-antitoxin system YoeB family toxin, partial [Streptosporangiaceae bacterium]
SGDNPSEPSCATSHYHTASAVNARPLGGEVWSRRITEKDRLVYDIQADVITVIACRFHYDDR